MKNLFLEPLESRLLPDAALVEAAYRTLLHREPEAGAVSGWLGYRLADDAQIAAVASSAEYLAAHPDWLAGLYHDLLGRGVDPVGRSVWDREGPYRAALGIVHSQEYRLRMLDPIDFGGGRMLAVGDLLAPAEAVYGDTRTLQFGNLDGTTETHTVTDLSFAPIVQSVLTLYLPDGTTAHPTLPAPDVGYGAVLGYDGTTAILAVPNAAWEVGGTFQLLTFTSADQGGTWTAGPTLTLPAGETARVDSVTPTAVQYTVLTATTHWTSDDPTPRSDVGPHVWSI